MSSEATSPLYDLKPKTTSDNERKIRAVWMSVLAKAELDHLDHCVQTLGEIPSYTFLRPVEIGLVMVQGRIGGSGSPFNLGEVPMTRCTIRLPELNCVGFGYVMGRSKRHAELAALCDGLLQAMAWQPLVLTQVIHPIQDQLHQNQTQQWQQTAATQVEFFTMAREHL